MWFRKLCLCGATGILLAGLSVTPVSAHGHHNQSNSAAKICSLCTFEDCTETGYHTHNDQAYCGYDHSCGYCDGSCGVVEVCSVNGCKETGYHTHDSHTYCGYDHEHGYCDGSCGVIAVCPVEDCTKTGRHTHDGETYCGYQHTDGYCDNSCAKQCESVTSTTKQSCGHRSGHHSGHHR